MKRLFCFLLTLPILLLAQNADHGTGQTAPPTADQIMDQVARNQDLSVAARSEFVYHQNLLIRMKRSNGKLAREETRDYTVTPTSDGVKRDLVHFSGTIGTGRKTMTYDKPEFRYKGIDVDGEIVQGFADDFGNSSQSKDGISHELFPLQSKLLPRFQFKLVGTEKWHGHDAFHIEYSPAEKRDIDDDCWAGDVLVDQAEMQPLEISSHLACKIPVLVKTLLGTNVRQVGFKVTYQKFDGVWFPVTYGGEFQFRAVFLYARSVGLGLINSDFQRTHVDSSITYQTE